MIADLVLYPAGVLAILGSIFCLLAAIGILRLPDLYTRMHAASKAGVMGTGLLFAAIALAALDGAVTLRAIAGVVFIMLTTPVGAHLLSRAAYLAGYLPDDITWLDELARKENTEK